MKRKIHADLGTLLPIYLAPETGEPPAGGAPSSDPLDRLAVLERDVSARTAEAAQARAESAALRKELVAEAEKTKALEAEVKALRADSDKAFLEGLRTQTAALQAPIDEKDLARVGELLAKGERERAKELAEIHLRLAKAKASKSPEGSFVRVTPTEPSQEDRKNRVEREAAILRDRGWAVELSQDGLTIVRAEAPGKGK